MFSYKFIVRAEKNNALRLRLTNNRKTVEISMGIRIPQETLDDALSTKPRPENFKWRTVITRYQSVLDGVKCDLLREGKGDMAIYELKGMVCDALNLCGAPKKEEVKEEPKGTFLPHFVKFSDMHPNKRTHEIYMSTLSRMKAYEPELEKLNFEDITVEWLHGFDVFLMEKAPKKNARNIHFRNIRAVMKDAFAADLTIAHPFDRFKHTGEPTRKRSFPVETIREIFNAEVEPWQQKYLDFFKLSFMLIGINVIDLCNLTRIHAGRIEYKRAKTGRLYSIKVEPEAMEIIKKYRGTDKLLSMAEGYADYRHFYNRLCKGLRAVKDRLMLDELTTYWARHTWATIARKIGVSVDDIALALGHADNKHETTFIYIDDEQVREAVDEANRRVLDFVLYGKC